MIGKMTGGHPKCIPLQISNPKKMSLCQCLCHKIATGDIYVSGSHAGVAESVPLRTRRIYPSLERGLLPAKKGRGAGKTKTTDVLDSCPEPPSLQSLFPQLLWDPGKTSVGAINTKRYSCLCISSTK